MFCNGLEAWIDTNYSRLSVLLLRYETCYTYIAETLPDSDRFSIDAPQVVFTITPNLFIADQFVYP